MEIFAISFFVFLASCAALAIGLWFGRGPIHGSCRPGDSSGNCAKTASCGLRCAKRRVQKTNQEI